MSKILNSVSRAFAATRDTKINYNVTYKGAASLLTGVYATGELESARFYRTPKIGDDQTTKLALIYGEVMISPYIIDSGVSSSTNDPNQILRTYRFIAGDGNNEGVVTPDTPGGNTLQNVYYKDPNGIPQPVINSDGRPSLGNVILASALGGAITSLPKIWDALKGTSPTKTGRLDPVTGKPIPTDAEKKAAEAAAKIPIGELLDVDDTGKANNTVLVYDANKSKWVPRNISNLLDDTNAVSSGEVCGGSGGSGGSGGTGGAGGDGGNPGDLPPAENVCEPEGSYTQFLCETPPARTVSGMQLLPALANTANNEYTQTINVLGTSGIEIHWNHSGLGQRATFTAGNINIENCPTGSVLECLQDDKKGEGETPASGTITYISPGSTAVRICITVTICGEEYLFFKSTYSQSGLSQTAYTRKTTIPWASTDINALLQKYPGQIFTSSNPNIKIYLQRTDTCTNSYDVYFEGYKRLIGDTFMRSVKPPRTTKDSKTTAQPAPKQTLIDDGYFPDQRPAGGALGAPSCPVDNPIPGTPGEPGAPGQPGGGGSAGTPGTCGSVTTAPPVPVPVVILTEPCTVQYGTQTVPGTYDAVDMPILTLDSGVVGDDYLEVVYEIIDGNGQFLIDGTFPGTVTAVYQDRKLSLMGPWDDIETTSFQVQFIASSDMKGVIKYRVTGTNTPGGIASDECTLVPNQLVVENSQAAKATVCIDSASTSGTGQLFINVNGNSLQLTNGPVPFTTNVNTTAQAVAASINARIATANALSVGSAGWMPAYVANASGNEITISAPAAGAGEFNNLTIQRGNTSGFVWGDCPGKFLGGVTKTLSDLVKFNPNWDAVKNVLIGVGGNVLGSVITNAIMNRVGQVEISLPVDEDVDVFFLYRGRKVQVPNEYNAKLRTGHPANYDAWSGVWKTQWTQNPAWCVYDYIKDKKSGLGSIIDLTTAQEQALLRDIFLIGKYADDIIDGKPRYSINTVITDGTRLEILGQMCSTFLGNFFWANGSLRIMYDAPVTTPSTLACQANCASISKTFTSAGNFINKVRATYVEPSNFYTEGVVVAEDVNGIDDFGERAVDVTLFGCTNQAEAKRKAAWVIDSEYKNRTVISYLAGLDHVNVLPGQIVEFVDNTERPGQPGRAGRVISVSGSNIVLDRVAGITVGDWISVVKANGAVHQTTVSGWNAGTRTVTLASAPGTVQPYAVWASAPAAVGRTYYRVIKKDETGAGVYSVTAQLYAGDKY